jgi:kinesin family protein 2/24
MRIDSDEGVYSQLQYLVERAKAGSMATLFMYGMTGSGKTYSTNLIHQKAPHELIAIGPVRLISYELIGKRCFDLLGAEKQEVHLCIGEDGATHVQGSTVREACTAAELQALLREAGTRRETSATGTNAESSRSHAVYQLSTFNGGTLTIIDLAGNEGNIETQYHTKEQMKQAAEINSSLMALRTCLAARSSGKSHIPFRESVLTRVLRDALTMQDAATAVLCCVSPACSHLERTLNTLRSAVNLTGNTNPTRPVDEELGEKGIVKGGPNTWDPAALATWIEEQKFGAHVVVPEGMNGQQIMRHTAVRLAPMCGDDMAVAKQLFDALRMASKEAAQKDRELRQAMKAGPKPVSSVGFSKAAPPRPEV